MLERVLRNTSATITLTFYSGESPVDADADVMATVYRADGTVLVPTGTAPHAGTGQYTVEIPAHASLNFLTVTATGVFDGHTRTETAYVEIVGGYYFPLAKLRAYDTALTEARFPTEKLAEKRQQVETEFEEICGRAFVPRFARENNLAGNGTNLFWLQHTDISAVTKLIVDGVDQLGWVTAGFVAFEPYTSALYLTGEATALGTAEDVEIEYEHGYPTPPYDVEMAALKRARGVLLGMNATIDERATVMNIPEFGTFQLSTPGQRGAHTGVPEIDVVLNRHTYAASQMGVY